MKCIIYGCKIIRVHVKDKNIEKAMRYEKTSKEGIFKEMKQRRSYENL